jgi:hypothetical protein
MLRYALYTVVWLALVFGFFVLIRGEHLSVLGVTILAGVVGVIFGLTRFAIRLLLDRK